MAEFLQQVVSGLASGGIYASLALALVLIYRATQVINFAQGEMAMFTTFVAWSLMNQMPYWPAFGLTLADRVRRRRALELVVIRPVQNAPVLTIVIVTIGLLIGLNGVARRIWGPEPRTLDSPFSTDPIRIGGVAFSIQDLGMIGVSLAIVALLFAVLPRTRSSGLALRAVGAQPGREPARRHPRQPDAGPRLGARRGARRGRRDDGRAAARELRPEPDGSRSCSTRSPPRCSAGSTARSAPSSAACCSA